MLQGRTFHGDQSPWRSKAEAMSKLIKDPEKLVRRAKAIADLYGVGDYIELPPGQQYDDEWKKEKDAFAPFVAALKNMGFGNSQIKEIAFYSSGKSRPELYDMYESINETLQLNGYTYKIVKYNGKSIYASQEGILGYNNILIPWLILDKIKEKL